MWARMAAITRGSAMPLPASDRHGWRECRRIAGAIPACLPATFVHPCAAHASTRSCPPQRGQRLLWIANTRRKRCAQLMTARFRHPVVSASSCAGRVVMRGGRDGGGLRWRQGRRDSAPDGIADGAPVRLWLSDDKSAGLPIYKVHPWTLPFGPRFARSNLLLANSWTAAGRPKGGAQGCAPPIPALEQDVGGAIRNPTTMHIHGRVRTIGCR